MPQYRPPQPQVEEVPTSSSHRGSRWAKKRDSLAGSSVLVSDHCDIQKFSALTHSSCACVPQRDEPDSTQMSDRKQEEGAIKGPSAPPSADSDGMMQELGGGPIAPSEPGSNQVDNSSAPNSQRARSPQKPIDVVADLVGGAMFNDLLTILRPEGRYTTAGAIAGPVVQLDLRTMYLKHLELHGSSQGTRAAFARLVAYIEEGKITSFLDRTFRLSEFHKAQQAFVNKDFVGKLVVVPDRHCDKVGAPHA